MSSKLASKDSLDELNAKRALLTYARFRFSPQTQPVRETAFDHYVQHILFVAGEPASVLDIQALSAVAVGKSQRTSGISVFDIQRSLNRLVNCGRIEREPDGKRYGLSTQARAELSLSVSGADATYTHVVESLFADRGVEPSTYKEPFFDFLCAVFSQLSESYIRLLRNDLPSSALKELPPFQRAIRFVTRKYTSIDKRLLEAAAIAFFNSSHPDFASVKWNLAQNYYVAKCLGIDGAGALLSEDVFKGAVFYLDTNVVVDALTPLGRHHNSFRTVVEACRRLDIDLNVAQISIDELRNVVSFAKRDVPRIVPRIPDALLPRVQSVFLDIFREAAAGGEHDEDRLFERFDDAARRLKDEYGVTVVDDSWFDAADSEQTLTLASRLKDVAPRRVRQKSQRAALHDAKLITWVQNSRLTGESRTFLITTDRSLPSIRLDSQKVGDRPVAMSLDAILQWLSPVAFQTDDDSDAAQLFSESLRQQILPRENFFDMADFRYFAEMEWDSKTLPVDDVEDAIRTVRAIMPSLDPTSSNDREKIGLILGKYFVDPGRRYRRDLSGLEAIVVESDASAAELRTACDRQRQQIEDLRADAAALTTTVENLQCDAKRSEIDAESAQRSLSVWRRIFGGVTVVVLTTVAWCLAQSFGVGNTVWQRMIYSEVFLFGSLVVAILAGCVVVGPRNLGILAWPVNRFFGTDE